MDRRTPLDLLTYLALVLAVGLGTARQVVVSWPQMFDSGQSEGMLQAAEGTPTLQATQPEPTPSPTPYILVAGSSSTIYLSRYGSRLSSQGDYACLSFELLPVETPQAVRITSQGLGKVTYWQDPETVSQPDTPFDCSDKTGGSAGRLELDSLTAPTTILARIGPLVLHNTGSVVEGKIVISARGISAVEIPVRAEKPPPDWYWSELTWFFRIAIPAIATAVLTYVGARTIRSYEAQKAREKAMDEFLQKHQNDIDEVFNNYYPILWKDTQDDDARFAEQIERELKNRGLLEELPWEANRDLRIVLDGRDRQKIVEELGRLFPPWKNKIKNPREDQR